MSTVHDISSFLPTVHRLADASAEVIRRYAGAPLSIESKHDDSPVTAADRAAEEVMRELIMSMHPDHGILGEEFGSYQDAAPMQWVLDPIDGTKSFISGTPLFGTLIALCAKGIPLLGCINMPLLEQRFIGNGQGTTRNGRTVRMRPARKLHEATVLVTDHVDVWKHKDGRAFDRLAGAAGIFRSWGDCYGYTLLVSGYADVMVDPVLSTWDMHALIPIVRGAGGIISSWEGDDPLTSNSLVAAHPTLHSDVIGMLNPPR